MSDALTRLIAAMPAEKRKILAELLRGPREPIAIIGMACRFPGGADSPDAFWHLLESGVDTVSEVPQDRWDINKYYDPDPSAPGKMSSRFGAFLDQIDRFDAPFFGLTPREAIRTDPQHRLLLEVSWEALENAGQPADRLAGTQTGVFAGLSTNDYWWLQVPDIVDFDEYAGMGGAHCAAAGRLSYLLDLRGPSVAVDTACSSSLVAVHLACQSLTTKECDLAIAGGVNVMASPIPTIALSRWGMLAPDGRCKTFDRSANGIARGEGCGMVTLKRLAEAVADDDRVLAVIYGSAINQDGRSTRFSAPNGHAQQAVIQRALDNAHVSPSQISLIEAHGTGTSLGDPIEFEALKAAVGEPRQEGERCALGSVKTNIGHLEAAAGIAGLIKTVLCLQHRTIPPHLHFTEPNPGIALNDSPFFIPKERTPWSVTAGDRYAGVSSFGLSGTNAHVVLGEAPPPSPAEPEAEATRAHILPISARSAVALDALARSYREWLLSPAAAGVSLADFCYTASVRRSRHPYRMSVTGRSKEELVERLGLFTKEPVVGPPVFSSRRMAFVFSGQGSQWAGMGKHLLHEDRVFRETVERCDALVRKEAGWSLLSVLNADQHESRLSRTDRAQPAIFAVQAALVERFRAWGIEPDAVVGHSVGEVAAAYAAFALSLEDAMRVAIHRGRVMQRVEGKGRMVAVGLSHPECERLIAAYGNRLSVAAINSPTSTVIAGEALAVHEVLESLKTCEVFCRDLGVDYPFHTSQMEPLLAELAEDLRDLKPRARSVRMLSTLTGADASGEGLDGRHWARTMRDPVRFADAIDRLLEDRYDLFIEIGPSHVLGTPITECLRVRGIEGTVLPSLRKGRDGSGALLAALDALFTSGRDIDWKRVYPRGRVVALPTYPWQRKRYWLSLAPDAPQPLRPPTAAERSNVGAYYDTVTTFTQEHHQEMFLTFAPLRERVPGFSWLLALHEPDKHPDAVSLIKDAQQELRRVLFRGIDFLSIRRVLDFGCGYGSDVISLAERHRHLVADGFTISTRQAEFANRQIAARNLQDRVSIYHCDSSKDEFPGHYDLVIGFEVAHYIDDKHQLFSNIDRHLADGGFVVLADFVSNTVSEIRDQTTSSYFPTVDQWSDLLASYKLRLVECVDVSQEMSNFLHDADAEANLDLLDKRAGDHGATRRHLRSYDGLGRLFRKKLCMYGLLTIQKDRYLAKEAIAAINRERLTSPTPYAEAAGWRARHSARTGTRLSIDDTSSAKWLYEIAWRHSPLPESTPSAGADSEGMWLIFADRSGVGEAVEEQFRLLGQTSVIVTHGPTFEYLGESRFRVCPSRADDFRAVLSHVLADQRRPCRGVIHLWGLDSTSADQTTPASLRADHELSCASLVYLAQALSEPEYIRRPRLWTITRGAQAVDAGSVLSVAQAPLWGLGRTIATEHSSVWGGLVDVDPTAPPRETARVLIDTILAGDGEDQVAWRRGERYVARLVSRAESRAEPGLRCDGGASYLLTGGLGALGMHVANWMVDVGARELILLQRSKLPPRDTWAQLEQGTHLADQIAAVQELESKGARVHIFSADVANEDQMESVLKEVRNSLAPLRGIIHAAGILDDAMLSQLNQDRLEQVMAPKVSGAWNLHRLTASVPLDFFVCFSSLASVLGSPGQANYAAANAGLDGLMHYRRGLGLPALSVNWGPWADAGMAAADSKRGDRVARHGFRSIVPVKAVRVLERLLQQERPQIAVVDLDIGRLKQSTAARTPLLSELLGDAAQVAPARGAGTVETSDSTPPIRIVISNADPAARPRLLKEYLLQEMAGILQLAPSEVSLNQPLNSLGIDSLTAVEIRNRIESDFQVRVPITSLLEGSSGDDLAGNILRQLQAKSSDVPARRAARITQQIEQMSDEAVRALLAEKRRQANYRTLS